MSPAITPATIPRQEPEPPGVFVEAEMLGPWPEPKPVEEPEPVKEKSLLEKYMKFDGKHGGQCVEFIQAKLNTYGKYPEFRGIAGNIKPNSTEPQVGGVVITNEGRVGHVALIVKMTEDYLILAESNMTKNDEVVRVGRQLKKDSERIVGYFNF